LGPKTSSRKALVGRARRPRKADQVVPGNRMGIANEAAPVFREDLEVQVDRVVLVGRARRPRKADPVVPGNPVGMADQVAPVFREDLEVLVSRARRPRKAVVNQAAPVFREDRVVQVDLEVLADPAGE
jgi:hypothetical protein